MPLMMTGTSCLSHLWIFLFILSSFAMSKEVAQKTVLQGNNHLTKNIYQILARNEGNIFFSPISIHAVLSMAAQGSGGSTKCDFVKVLGIEDTNVAANGYQEIMNNLKCIENITLYMANKIFLMKGYEMKQTFKDVVVRNFYSDVQQLDFSEAVESAKVINTWVEEKTNNKIKDLIPSDSLNKDSRLVLVNAIYFKGNWAEKFKVENTRKEKFYLKDGNTMDVNMMHLKSKRLNYKFDVDLDSQVLEMPYQNKDVSMVFILPNKRDGIVQLEQKLIQTDLTKITENMHKPTVEVSIPKFKIETTLDLKNTLTEIGLGSIFSSSANFSEMLNSPEELYVSKVIQKAFIEVNEEGAEAAAATGMVVMMRKATRPTPPKVFQADHPFVIKLIRNSNNISNVLFSGRISKPIY